MNLARYLLDSASTLATSLVGGVLAAFVVRQAGASLPLSALVAVIVLAAGVVAVLVSYGRRARFYREVEDLAASGGDAAGLMDLVEEPDFLEGRLAYEAIRSCAKLSRDEAAASRRRVHEYREYIEAWVHEAKSPLAAAHLMAENLRADPAVPDAAADRAAALDEELDRAEGYVEQALFFARSEALDRDYLIRAHGLRELVGATLRDNARLLIGAHVAPRLGELDLEVFTDEKWMRFILGQVVQNSVKYARAEGAEVSFAAELLDEGASSERVVLSVRDNGRGVCAADLPRVFDKGFTGEAGRSGKKSTGIGLYLVRRLCDKMGVAVEADSAAGEFFEVRFGFPTNKYHYFER